MPETADVELAVEQLPERTFVIRRGRQPMEKVTTAIPTRIGETAGWGRVAGPPDPFELVTYEPTRAAVCDHLGPFENLLRTYAALERALAAAGLVPTGPAFELYETNPDEEPDPQKWLTVIVWPVE